MQITTKKIISILLMLLVCFSAHSQGDSLTNSEAGQKSKQVEISFDLDRYVIDPDFQNNRENLAKLSDIITKLQSDSLITISSVKINSYASPEGGSHYNKRLTKSRTNSIYNYLHETTSIPDSIIVKENNGIDWDGLQHSVESSTMKYRDEILYILRHTPIETWRKVNPNDKWLTLTDSRNKQLMDLKGGRPYHYMAKEIFPQLRRGSIITIYFEVAPPIIEADKSIEISRPLQEVSALEKIAPLYREPNALDNTAGSQLFALKTNLLFDVALMPSIEVEVPISERWSVAGEWIFPWWITKDNGNALQILSAQLEGRYWFGNRVGKPQLTGWFAGLYAGGGLYDLQWKNNGYQGEFYIAAGACAGYAHTINKSGSLRMEYSLGLGYLQTDYRYYEGMQNNKYLVWQYDGSYSWLGPTKAKVSLVWFINSNRGGGRR